MSEKYYIGDLCYILPDSAYDEIVCSFKYDDGQWHKIGKYEFAFANTKYGDGVYSDNKGNSYPVDAGIIGILRLKATGLTKQANALAKEKICAVHTFDEKPTVYCSDGHFRFGGVAIDTDLAEDDSNDYEGAW